LVSVLTVGFAERVLRCERPFVSDAASAAFRSLALAVGEVDGDRYGITITIRVKERFKSLFRLFRRIFVAPNKATSKKNYRAFKRPSHVQ
jgi:hypothetical protein